MLISLNITQENGVVATNAAILNTGNMYTIRVNGSVSECEFILNNTDRRNASIMSIHQLITDKTVTELKTAIELTQEVVADYNIIETYRTVTTSIQTKDIARCEPHATNAAYSYMWVMKGAGKTVQYTVAHTLAQIITLVTP